MTGMRYLTNCIIIIIFFISLAAGIMLFPQITQTDIWVINSIQNLVKDLPTSIPLFFAGFGYANRLIIPLVILCGILIWKRRYFSCALAVLAVQGAYLFSDTLKEAVMRNRPPFELRLCPIENYSFPSGHALVNMCFFGICIYLLNKHLKSKQMKIVSNIIFGGYILFIGFTRLWLGVHFPTDIIGGYLAGLFLVYIFAELDEKLQKEGVTNENTQYTQK